MKIGFISDLHIDYLKSYLPEDMMRTLATVSSEQELDYLIIGGDISNHVQTTINFIETLDKELAPTKVYFIPGNHDYWQDRNEEKQTWELHKIFESHPQSLMKEPLIINDNLAIVGHLAWYNHAFYQREKFTPEQIEAGRYKIATWQDKQRMSWNLPDSDVSRIFKDDIINHLNRVGEREIVLVTHMVTTPDFIIPMPNRAFDFFNAFIATNDLDDVIKEYPVSHSIMGHVHIRHSIYKDNVTWVTNSLAYEKEWRSDSIRREIEHALYVLDTDKQK